MLVRIIELANLRLILLRWCLLKVLLRVRLKLLLWLLPVKLANLRLLLLRWVLLEVLLRHTLWWILIYLTLSWLVELANLRLLLLSWVLLVVLLRHPLRRSSLNRLLLCQISYILLIETRILRCAIALRRIALRIHYKNCQLN